MKTMTEKHPEKCGAALVIALGFLAVLTIIIVAFTAQMRTERLADRGFLGAVRNQQLLNTALARAMEDIALNTPANTYPPFDALSSQSSLPLSPAVDFTDEEAFIPGSGSSLFSAYQAQMQTAGWETVAGANNKPLGRIGYVVINTSGLLDANAVGGYTNLSDSAEYTRRERGASPAELRLTSELLPDFSPSTDAGGFPGIRLDENGDLEIDYLQATAPHLSPALAMVYNRKNAWRHFETLRDFHELNQLGSAENSAANIIVEQPVSFRTHSFFPPEPENRAVMGQTLDEVTEHADAIRAALSELGITGESADFVFQQLKDYIDVNSTTENLEPSVEPVPLINELLYTCDFRFTPVVESVEIDPGDGGEIEFTNVVSSVVMTNLFKLEVEAWFPFVDAENGGQFTIVIEDVDSDLPDDLFGDIRTLWLSAETSVGGPWQSGHIEEAIFIEGIAPGAEYFDIDEMTNAFDLSSAYSVDDIELICYSDGEAGVDIASGIELDVGGANFVISSNIGVLAEFLFQDEAATGLTSYTNYLFTIGAATIDPRLNWDGQNTNHWVQTGENGYGSSMGVVNDAIINELSHAPTGEPRNMIYVRNQGRIDSPYEFTYFLFDINRPWHTFQFFPENDRVEDGADLETRRIAELLTAVRREPQLHGLLNPNSSFTNLISTALFDMPIDELVQTDFTTARRASTNEAIRIAEELIVKGPYLHRTNMVDALSYTNVAAILEGGNTWANESLLRNAMDLFSTRDSTFTILLTAQEGTDADGNSIISDDEVQGTQKAVVQVWRDPVTGKSTCTFYGMGDTLQNSYSGSSLGNLLDAFQPAQ